MFAFATIWLFPGKHLILTETAIFALFALSLDLILGYAGIISLGQAAFFGLAGYFAGLLAKYGIDQRAGHRARSAPAWLRRRSVLSPAFWFCAART